MNKNAVSEFKGVATEFEKNNAKIENFDDELDKIFNDHRSHEELTSEEKMIHFGVAFTKAVKEQQNNTLGEVNLKEFRKAYIHGHGLAGTDVHNSGSSVYSAKKLVDLLIDNGFLSEIKDIILTGCYSADKRRIKNMTKEEINKANQEPGLLEKILYGQPQSFMEKVANEIWSRGYTDVSVSGYHGLGVVYNDEIPFSHLQSAESPPTQAVKRQSVRKTLVLENGVVRTTR